MQVVVITKHHQSQILAHVDSAAVWVEKLVTPGLTSNITKISLYQRACNNNHDLTDIVPLNNCESPACESCAGMDYYMLFIFLMVIPYVNLH